MNPEFEGPGFCKHSSCTQRVIGRIGSQAGPQSDQSCNELIPDAQYPTSTQQRGYSNASVKRVSHTKSLPESLESSVDKMAKI